MDLWLRWKKNIFQRLEVILNPHHYRIHLFVKHSLKKNLKATLLRPFFFAKTYKIIIIVMIIVFSKSYNSCTCTCSSPHLDHHTFCYQYCHCSRHQFYHRHYHPIVFIIIFVVNVIIIIIIVSLSKLLLRSMMKICFNVYAIKRRANNHFLSNVLISGSKGDIKSK